MNRELSTQQAAVMASIYKRYANDVRKYIAVSIQDDVEAEDMMHDVMERAMQVDTITEETAHALLIVTAKRKIIDYFRHKGIAKRVSHELTATMNWMDATDAATQMTVRQVLQLEQKAVSRLKGKEAAVYHLWRQGDKTMKEMAVALDINHRSIERYVYDSRRKVAEYIRKAI